MEEAMSGDGHGTARSVDEVLLAHERYRTSLIEMCRELGLAPHEGSSPQQSFARVLVASIVGGTPLPQGHFERYHVLGRDGGRIAVYTADDSSSAVNGWVIKPDEVEGVDAVALVMFINHRPRAVHLIPLDRVAPVSRELGVGRCAAGSLTMNRALAENILMEPVVAAVMGVATTLLP